jgi:hypothetical protein
MTQQQIDNLIEVANVEHMLDYVWNMEMLDDVVTLAVNHHLNTMCDYDTALKMALIATIKPL